MSWNGSDVLNPDHLVLQNHVVDVHLETRALVKVARNTFEECSAESSLATWWNGHLARAGADDVFL